MITKTIQITEITFDELADKVADKLLDKIEVYLKELNKDKIDTFMTRQETADFLKISLTSLWHWTKLGIVKSYSLGSRRYYNKKEIINYLQNIN
ncbi:helix-turn-helix domain-containing protein [Aestuariivivens sediminis]|uniref:helix-turn-helix domain-containing protein n=1 Tax=Aestuariivivens sediminis TaxID=2913557 RepID=UPI001F587FEE|nr:helix-turn-helix domain-containing protein [Aestuariivivens sediminis]